jgi:DNA-binding MarR family transcriptional regulator
MKETHIAEMRGFNRWYTSLAGVLNRKFLNGKFTLPELRVLHAIRSADDGVTANELVPLLHIDKSYLSKIIIRFEKKKYLTKKVSRSDGRTYHLALTGAGRKEFEVYDKLSDEYARQILVQVTEREREELMACMRRIKEILEGVRI